VNANQRLTKLRDWILLLFCNLIWASQFVMVKLVQEEMGPLFAVTFPIGVATIMLAVLVARRGSIAMPRAHWWPFFLLGVGGQVVAQLFITWGVRLSLASNAALLCLALPILTAVIAHFLLGELMNRIRWISFGLAIAGVTICSGVDWKELNLHSSRYLVGNLLILASITGSAFYNVYSKRLLEKYNALQVLLYSYYTTMLVMLPVTLWAEPLAFAHLLHYSRTVWTGLMILSLFQYFLSMVIFLNVLTRLDATQVALSNYLIPFFGLLIAATVLHEHMTIFMWAGGALALASTLLITLFDWSEPAPVTVAEVGP
jgi:drug/metabolite transporter (DMT)-like permease